MSYAMRVKVFSPLLLAAATVVALDGANGGNGLRRDFHSDSHVGPYDECFRDRRTGQGHCTGRHWGPHSGPHRGLHRGDGSAALY